MQKKLLAVLFGGCSVEHEISLISAKSIVENLDRDSFDILPVFISKEGRWFKSDINKLLSGEGDISSDILLLPSTGFDCKPTLFEILNDKITQKLIVDVVFPVLHGTYGEDGTVQGALELMGVPFVGASVLGSAVGMDKILMKSILRNSSIPVVDFIGFTKDEWDQENSKIIKRINDEIRSPCFVKSADLGSSVGIKKIQDIDIVQSAIEYSFRFSNRVLVEKAVINAREIEVSVLGGSSPDASVPGEIVSKRDFYDYESKYHDDSTDLIIPAKLDNNTILKLQDYAVKTFKVLSCSGMGRVDFLMNEYNEIFVSEINTIPGFTSISMYPKLWEASGLSYKALISKLIDIAFEDFDKKMSLKTNYKEA